MKASTLIRETAARFQLSTQDILSPRRDHRARQARWQIMWALRERGWSTPRIGAAVNRHHTTVLYALGRLNK